MKSVVVALAVVLTMIAAGCSKSDVDCLLTVNMRLKINENATDTLPAEGRVMVHTFVADTAAWDVLSYDDALNGIITARSGGERKSPLYSGATNVDGSVEFMLANSPIMVVVCDLEDDIYAWRDGGIVGGLPSMTIGFTLKPYIRDETYTEMGWTIVNGKTAGPVEEDDDEEDETRATLTYDARFLEKAASDRLRRDNP